MQKKTVTHLTMDDRIRIEALLKENFSLRYISDRIDKSPSYLSKKLKKQNFENLL